MRHSLRWLVCGLVCLGLLGCSSGSTPGPSQAPSDDNGSRQTAGTPGDGPSTPAESDPLSGPPKKLTRGEIIDRADRCVVLIETTNSAGEPLGTGSGFLVDARGWVATCWHVAENASGATAKLRDGTELEFEGIVAVNKDNDMAVLKLTAPLPEATPLELGPAEPPRQGDAVTAIGHPHGFNFTMTDGIVSAVRRSSELPEEFANQLSEDNDTLWIQTTAAISGGNSGGPLLDEYGRVVGINTWVAVGENLGFAGHISHLSALLERPLDELQPLPGDQPLDEMETPLAQLEPGVISLYQDFEQAARQQQIDQLNGKKDAPSPAPKYAERFYQLANDNRGTLVAFQALWVACQLDDIEGEAAVLKKSLERLGEDHLGAQGLHTMFTSLARSGHEATHGFLRKVIADSPHARNQGLATMYLAVMLQQSEDSEQHHGEVVALLERCQEEFKDVKIETGRGMVGLGEFAKPYLHKIKHLSVGGTAMEIVGKDIEGAEFKLSDYRGKVVLLDFFADWCPYCTTMYPHEREMVKQLAEKPFALLGVNTDSPVTLQQLIRAEKVTWRCWTDGRGGPIAREWQITGYPCLYLLDHEGVIRHVYNGRPDAKELDAKIAELIERVPTGEKAGKGEKGSTGEGETGR